MFEEYLYNLRKMNVSNVDVILEYNKNRILEKNILHNTNWTPSRLEFKHRFLYFREIHLSNDVKCVW